jgi:tRNA uridine 5-carbamoylmethylation protein Kti12
MRHQVYILRGVPGSGKSTMTKRLLSGLSPDETSTIVSADHWFEKSGSYQFDPTQLGQAHGNSQKSFIEALKNGVSVVIVDNTNIKNRDMKLYIDQAKKFNYDWEIVQLEAADPQNIHGVPSDTVASMVKRLASEVEKMPEEWKHHTKLYTR